MKLIIFSNVSHRCTTKHIIVISGKDNEQQTNHTVQKWINHMNYKNMKYWDNNIALVQV
jgi:hypothetical protein